MAPTQNQLKLQQQLSTTEQNSKKELDILSRKHPLKAASNQCPHSPWQDVRESLPEDAHKTVPMFGKHSLTHRSKRRQTLTSAALSMVTTLILALLSVQAAGENSSDASWAEAPNVQVVPVQGDQVQDLCDAQCAAMCITLGDEVCEDICGKSGQRRARPWHCSWLLKCQHSGCTGSCSKITQTDANGPIPDTPQISVTRDVWTGYINISWPIYSLDGNEQTVYLVSQKTGYCSWAQLGWVIGNRYIVTNISDMCRLPTYRVAAVSRFGSRWFSKEVETPALVPGPPRGLKVRLDSTHTADQKDAVFSLEWKPPEDWPPDNLRFDLLSKVDCPALIDEVYIYRDDSFKVDLTNETIFVVTGRIPLHAIGCTITFLVGSKPICKEEARVKAASIASTTINFECSELPNYKGDLCKFPPVGNIQSVQGGGVYPSPVRNVTLMVLPVPGDQKFLARVFWLPPERLGSAGYVDKYHLFWGIVELGELDFMATFKKDIASTVVSGNRLEDELLLNISSFQPYETLGVVIQAAGPNQTVIHSFSSIHKSVNSIPPNYDFSPEDVIANSSTVYVIQTTDRSLGEPKVKVDVFWLRPELSLGLDIASYQVTLRPNQIDRRSVDENVWMGPDLKNITKPRHFETTKN